ncbi:uncharacterized protein SCHCODRAFT_02277838 [Schizophyllum commune H4-8]|uniref:uncharacterized protein n=1 Tax=Schizophyllum commune (strain H4-8 / FGSC 9210) TaxID=578458 RepID=UPI00215DF741|nr:uncharacterized protein SCHCODRAFT_02277838 [Schizophyllum commune H4-8]KAI5891925.1 hypothetical protein SCHCODRAFT_02277838 [Schizophyllum commune H4-8]
MVSRLRYGCSDAQRYRSRPTILTYRDAILRVKHPFPLLLPRCPSFALVARSAHPSSVPTHPSPPPPSPLRHRSQPDLPSSNATPPSKPRPSYSRSIGNRRSPNGREGGGESNSPASCRARKPPAASQMPFLDAFPRPAPARDRVCNVAR